MSAKTTVLEKIEKHSIPEPYSGCWLWTGYITPDGYPRITHNNGVDQLAHRAAYKALVGPIPDRFTIDHLCRTKACVNPAHMEPVLSIENVRRGTAGKRSAERRGTKTHCKHGHEYTPENTAWYRPKGRGYLGGSYRTCLQCRKRYGSIYYAKKKAPKTI